MSRPTITIPAPPPAPPMIPAAPIYGSTEEEKIKRKLFDPKRVGRQQTILTGPKGLLEEETTKRAKLGSRDTPKGS